MPGLGKDSPKIGYIKLASFNQNASGEHSLLLVILCHIISRSFTFSPFYQSKLKISK